MKEKFLKSILIVLRVGGFVINLDGGIFPRVAKCQLLEEVDV